MIPVRNLIKSAAICFIFGLRLAHCQNITTHGSCSPVINGNSGTISVHCNVSNLEPRVLNALQRDLEAVVSTLRIVNQENNDSFQSIRYLKTQNSLNKERLRVIEGNVYQTQKRLDSERSQYKFQLDKLKQRLDDIAADAGLDSDFTRSLIASVSDTLESQIEKHELKLSTISATVAEHSVRINALEKDVNFLMDRFSRGDLEEGVFLLGSKVGTGSLPDASFVEAALELDYLTTYSLQNRWPIAATVSLGRVQSSFEKVYPTYSGAPPIINHFTNSSNYMTLGGQVTFQPIVDRIFPFFGLSLSYYRPAATGSRQTLGPGIAGGLSWAIASSRLSIEIAYRQIPTVQHTFTFNPFGSSNSDTQAKKVWSPSLALKYAFR